MATEEHFNRSGSYIRSELKEMWKNKNFDQKQNKSIGKSLKTSNSRKKSSEAKQVKTGTVPTNILEFDYCYTYDCQRYFNLCVADPRTIVFASGNYVHFFNVSDKKMWFHEGSAGGGIAHIAKNPVLNHLAIAENGNDPLITIYSWPTMSVVVVLKGGALKRYFHITYSPDGLLLASQAGEPDYSLTIWNWQESKIITKCKSYNQSVYCVMFSSSLAGHLTTCGSNHIKFWKMSETFTGLKLKGILGKFGKTEASDIIGTYSMPDEKVISGCEWGNILIWQEGSIKLEVCRKNKRTCHDKQITQFEYINGELLSIGMDGWIKAWFYESIDQANPTEDNKLLEIEPIYEFQVMEKETESKSSSILCIKKQDPTDPRNSFWYAQDSNGALWLLNLDTTKKAEFSTKIFICHKGPIMDIATADWGPFVATLGKDGKMHIYNHEEKKLSLVHQFHDAGSQITWLPCMVEPKGLTLICAFATGIIRMVMVTMLQAIAAKDTKGDYVRLISVLKPHLKAVTAMSLNPSSKLLVTGSEDSTVFVFSIVNGEIQPEIIPIGYVKVPSCVTCMIWQPGDKSNLLVGGVQGYCSQVQLPLTHNNHETYELQCEISTFRFCSVKSAIQREILESKLRKAREEKRSKKREEMLKLMEECPGIEIDEESFLMDSEEELSLPEIYIPQPPNDVLAIYYTEKGTIWLLMGGYDTGLIYEYSIVKSANTSTWKSIKNKFIFDAENIEIQHIISFDDYFVLSMKNGVIRVCRKKFTDLSDLSDYWQLPVHDWYNGLITKMVLSYDKRILFTSGYDGNLFALKINHKMKQSIQIPQLETLLSLPKTVEDITESEYPTLEETVLRENYDKERLLAKQEQEKTIETLCVLSEEYKKLVERNRRLLKSQQLSLGEFELDFRITEDRRKQLENEMELEQQRVAYKLQKSEVALQKLKEYFIEPISCLPFAVQRVLKPETMVHSLREKKLDIDFETVYAKIKKLTSEELKEEKIEFEEEGTLRLKEHTEIGEKEETENKIPETESFLKEFFMKEELETKVGHILKRYTLRKQELKKRERERKILSKEKPDSSVNNPEDLLAIEEARKSIGDYKFKTHLGYNESKFDNTTLSKYKILLNCREKLHTLRENFNEKLRNLRFKKESLRNEILISVKTLERIHAEIPPKYRKPLPDIPSINIDLEYPEKNLELKEFNLSADELQKTEQQNQPQLFPSVFNVTDEEYEVLYLDNLYFNEQLGGRDLHVETIHTMEQETSWEKEMKRSRVARKLYEQDLILQRIKESCENLDEELDELERERIEIVTESVYLELFSLTTSQEFFVSGQYEVKENVLKKNVTEKGKECALLRQKIQMINEKVEYKTNEISKFHSNIKSITTEYLSAISGNKFENFLRGIFRKKHKPQKEETDSETESSTETESDDKEGSIENDEMEIQYDESICPPGCPKELYSMAFTMRERRFDEEMKIKETVKMIENFRKETEIESRKLRLMENELKDFRNELQAFMLEKQQKLNDIDATVILKFHQIQNFVDSNPAKLTDCVLFDTTKLSSLYRRIEELQMETTDLKTMHKKNRSHLHRIKLDCEYMDTEINRLKQTIKEETIKKFGREVSLTDLYETTLQKMAYDAKRNLTEALEPLEEEFKCIKEKYKEETKKLDELIQENTAKLSFLTLLQEEQSKLQKILKKDFIPEKTMQTTDELYATDLKKLTDILKQQENQKSLFKNDIKNLSLKSRSVSRTCLDKSGEKQMERQGFD